MTRRLLEMGTKDGEGRHGPHHLRPTVMREILSGLRMALATYPRRSGETLTTWYDRVIARHVAAPEYALSHALGLAEGSDVDMLSDEFEAALARPEDPIDEAVDGSVLTTD